ncbi:MAG TPA: pyrroloquinoline quinone biosynthesis peptide chaperone PqqD [Polyangiaceae bacterium]|nr:pyrroloquinoline quinone biosynthesis peptide chaperone PqqD [Polyangiaceae bacterium]
MKGPRLAARARLKWDRVGNHHLLLYPERGMALSESAAAILKLCDGDHSVDAIVEEMARTHGAADPEIIRRDVVALLEAMRKRGLVD